MNRVMLLACVAAAVTMMTVPAWAQTDPPSPSAATRPDSPNLTELAPRLRAIREAPDPAAALDAYAKAQAVAPADPAAQAAFVQRMVELGLPEMAETQARDLVRQDPNRGLAWGVLGDAAAKHGHIIEALADLTSAYRLAPDEHFIQRTAGHLLAWYDANATHVAVPEATLAGVLKMQKELQDKPAYAEAYHLAAQIYRMNQALGRSGPGGYPGGRPGATPGAGAGTDGITAAFGAPATAPGVMVPPDTLGLPVPNYDYYSPAPQFYATYPAPPPPAYVTPPSYDSSYWWPTYCWPVIVGPVFAADFDDFGGFHRFHHDRDFHDGHNFHHAPGFSPAPGAAIGGSPGPMALPPQFHPGGFFQTHASPPPTAYGAVPQFRSSTSGQRNPAGFWATVGQPPPPAQHQSWSGVQPHVNVNHAVVASPPPPPPPSPAAHSAPPPSGGGGGGKGGGGDRHH